MTKLELIREIENNYKEYNNVERSLDVVDRYLKALIAAKPIVSGRSEQLAISALQKIEKVHSETYSAQLAREALKEISNCH